MRRGGCPGPAPAAPLEARRAGGAEAAAVASPAPSYLRRECLPAPPPRSLLDRQPLLRVASPGLTGLSRPLRSRGGIEGAGREAGAKR